MTIFNLGPGAGDAIRGRRLVDETGTSASWYTLGRNKAGPPVGSHSREIFGDPLGLSEEEIEALRAQRVV